MKQLLAKKSKDRNWLLVALACTCLAVLFDFWVMGIMQYQGDTPTYVAAINYVRTGELPKQDVHLQEYLKIRIMKPVYALAGAILPLQPEASILALNLLFFFLAVIAIFLFLRELEFGPRSSALGAAWFASSYPVLKYGLGLITDMGGYLFIALSILVALKAIKSGKLKWFALTGLVCGLGALVKETGAFGILFALGAILSCYKKFGWKQAFKYCACIALVFCLIFFPIQIAILLKLGYSLINFWNLAQAHVDRSIKTFVGIYGAAFHILWVYAAIGA
jgi:4-amino-4-deoxy-L-arabinose transferase-like glycosyltransferase